MSGSPTGAGAAVWLLLLSAPAAGEIVAGPWLQDVRPYGITVMWETDSAGESWVDFGPDQSYGWTAGSSSAVDFHEVQIFGLSPETPYHYRVRTGTYMSGDAVLRTAPPQGNSDFRFLVYGDSRTNHWVHTEVADAMLTVPAPGFVLHSGDIVSASTSARPAFREEFLHPLDELCSEVPIYVSRGNHEATNPLFTIYLSHPSASSGSEDYFSFDYGNVHVVALDTTKPFDAGSAQHSWLESDLQAASVDPAADWIVALFHHPPYTTGAHGPYLDVRAALCPLFETYGVDLVFNGHDHDYERISQRNGVVYVVTGGGAAPLRDQLGSEPYSACYRKLHHFVVVDVQEHLLTVTARGVQDPGRPDGHVFDSVVIGNNPLWSPTADAGQDRIAHLGSWIVLDGSGSFDAEADPFTYQWSQVAGPPVTLFESDAEAPFFLPKRPGPYTFELRCLEQVSFASYPDRVRVGVKLPREHGEYRAQCVADTWIDSGDPQANHGSATLLGVDAGSPWGISYLRFELPVVAGEVLTAKLRLYCENGSDLGGYVRRFSDSTWDESVPTYADPLIVDGDPVGVFGPVQPGSWAETDIRAAFPDGTDPGPSLSLAIFPSSTDGADYHSREAAFAPELILRGTGRRMRPRELAAPSKK